MTLGGVRVLVVDDEPDAREPLRRALERAGAEVLTAASAAEVLESVSRERPDVVVSDIGMPGRDGYELVRSLRGLSEGAGRTPTIALTAYASPDDRERVLRAGFEAHMAKPVDALELIAVLERIARRSAPR